MSSNIECYCNNCQEEVGALVCPTCGECIAPGWW